MGRPTSMQVSLAELCHRRVAQGTADPGLSAIADLALLGDGGAQHFIVQQAVRPAVVSRAIKSFPSSNTSRKISCNFLWIFTVSSFFCGMFPLPFPMSLRVIIEWCFRWNRTDSNSEYGSVFFRSL